MTDSVQHPAQAKDDLQSALQHASKLLALGLSQLNQARLDNDCHMQQLIQAHTTLAEYLTDEQPAVHQALQNMVIAFQGHDELNQRLEHFQWLFQQIADALSEPTQLTSASMAALDTDIERRYTTTTERIVHRHYRRGKLETTSAEQCASPHSGSIELF